MHKNSNKIGLKSYLDLEQLLHVYKGSHEENRTFALLDKNKRLTSLKKLLVWEERNRYHITDELNSTKYLHYLKLFTSLFGFVLLLLGFSTGFALLSYSGAEPVNVIWLLLVMVGLPLISMTLSLLSMVGGSWIANFFSHLSIFYYLEKVINFLPFANKVEFSLFPISSRLSRWIFLQRIQLFSLLFSIGLFMALLLTVVSKDIAFGWSSTLQITPETFHSILSYLSMPWSGFAPSAVPSLELIELSHYFRLGEEIDTEMVKHADKLGAWWKFLAMATLFYAIVLRLLFWLMAHFGVQKVVEGEILRLDGVKTLLKQFDSPYVSTQAQQQERHLDVTLVEESHLEKSFEYEYSVVVGWNYTEEDLLLLKDSNRIEAKTLYVVGGRNSFKEDQVVVNSLDGKVLLYVKAWEPPTMDFIDLLESIIEKKEVSFVDVAPLGTVTNNYHSRREDVEIWLRKLEIIESEKLGVIDV